MNLARELPLRTPCGHVRVVVETPRGSSLKLKYDEDSQTFDWSRALSQGVCFPCDFGFFPQTLAPDGDPLDAMVVSDVASYPGVVIKCRVLGAICIEQERDGVSKRNDRILVVPSNDHRASHLQDIGDFSERFRSELDAFCHHSLALTGKVIRIVGWENAAGASKLVRLSEDAFGIR